jgi:hypothetical protein
MLDGVVLCQAPPEAGGGGFVAIFNGKDLTGWVVDGRKSYEEDGEEKPVWAVEEGMIVCRGRGGGFLRYDRKLKDFIVRLEYRMSKRCNSGLGIRGVVYTGEDSTRPSRAGYEIQISDDAGRDPGKRSSGSLYRYVAPKVNASKPADEWNAIEVECRGPRIRVTLNEQVIHDLDQTTIEEIKDKPLAGYFSVQNHGKLIDFRNIKLKEL